MLSYGEFVELINMQDAALLLLALTYKCGSAGSAHYIKIGDGRLCMQWPHASVGQLISTTNLAACVCVSSKFDQFLPARFYFVSKRPENCVRIAKFPYAAFGPLFAFHCPLFVTKNNNLGWNRHASPHTGTCRCNDHGPTVLSARGQYTLAMTC